MKLALLTRFIPIIKRNWKIILLGAVFLGFVWHYTGAINERNDLRIQVSSCEERVERFVENEKRYQDVIREQNEAVTKLSERTEELRQRASEAEEERKTIQENLQSRIIELSERRIGDSCEEAMDFLYDYSQEMKE